MLLYTNIHNNYCYFTLFKQYKLLIKCALSILLKIYNAIIVPNALICFYRLFCSLSKTYKCWYYAFYILQLLAKTIVLHSALYTWHFEHFEKRPLLHPMRCELWIIWWYDYLLLFIFGRIVYKYSWKHVHIYCALIFDFILACFRKM